MKIIDTLKYIKEKKRIDNKIMENLKLNAESLRLIRSCNVELEHTDEKDTQRFEELLFEIKVQTYYIYIRKNENKNLIKRYTRSKDLLQITKKVNNYLYVNDLIDADI